MSENDQQKSLQVTQIQLFILLSSTRQDRPAPFQPVSQHGRPHPPILRPLLLYQMSKEEEFKKLTGTVARSQLCCQDQGGEPFRLNGIDGKIWDSIHQHEEQHQQVFLSMIEVCEMLVHQVVQYTQCCHLGFQIEGRNG